VIPGGTELLEDARALQEFWGYFLFDELKLFRGSEDPKIFVSNYLREEAKSVHDDQREAENGEVIRPGVIRCVFDYVSLIRRIGEFVCDRARREFTDEQLRLVQTRTYFDFGAWMVRLLFIVDADPRSEMSFSDLLARIERIVTLEGCFVPQLMYINKRVQNIDGSSVSENYPFICKFRTDE
jgi:hypothetical protein